MKPENPKNPNQTLGSALQQYRVEVGATQAELARVAKVGERTVRHVEGDGPCSKLILQKIILGLNQLRGEVALAPLTLTFLGAARAVGVVVNPWLRFPNRQWQSRVHGPGALLTADYRVVPFHGAASLRERDALRDWCQAKPVHGIRVYKGEGGVGKTRLAVELCHLLAEKVMPTWTTGFANAEDFERHLAGTSAGIWSGFTNLSGPVLIVVDYAGDPAKANMISKLLEKLSACPAPKVRLLFLERDDLWLDRLHARREVREVLLGPLLSHDPGSYAHELPAVGSTSKERQDSWRMAAKAFATALRVAKYTPPSVTLEEALYKNRLVIHSHALLTVIGTRAESRAAILRHLLAREQDYWARRLEAVGLPRTLLPAVEQAMYQISAVNGVADRQAALDLLARVPLLDGQPPLVIEALLTMLRECYPNGPTGIGPVQPDSLKEFLVRKHLRSDEPPGT